MFNTENLFPLLVDEIETSFFYRSRSPLKGEGLIKYVSNDLATKHPVLIGTTNKSDFSSSAQILRRIYYLEINNVFDSKRKVESLDYLNEIISDVDNSLFQDFCMRFSKMIKNEVMFYKTDDLLYGARLIFKSYYKELGLDIPKWFPEEPFNDYRERMIVVWRNIYLSHKESFKDNGKNTMYVYLDEICKYQKSYKEKDKLINFLDDTCIKENASVLEVYKDKFFDFIQIKMKKKRFSISYLIGERRKL